VNLPHTNADKEKFGLSQGKSIYFQNFVHLAQPTLSKKGTNYFRRDASDCMAHLTALQRMSLCDTYLHGGIHEETMLQETVEQLSFHVPLRMTSSFKQQYFSMKAQFTLS
jgi:hypothetical protein